MRNWILGLVVLAAPAAYAGAIAFTGHCESRLLRESFSHDLSEGTVHIGRYAELERTLLEGKVPEKNVKNVIQILDGAKNKTYDLGPFADALQMLDLLKLKDHLYVCVEQGNCKSIFGSRGAAYYLKYDNQRQLSYIRFSGIPDPNSEEWLDTQVVAERGAEGYVADGEPRAIVLKSHLTDETNRSDDPLARIVTFESAFFHELLHAGDAELVKLWVVANARLRSKGEETDELFKRFVRCEGATGRCFVSSEFSTLFTESRAYYLSLLVRNLFTPKDPMTDTQIFFTAWMAVMAETASLNPNIRFNIAKEAGLPSGEDLISTLKSPDKIAQLAARMKEIAIGPDNWGMQMKRTINRAF